MPLWRLLPAASQAAAAPQLVSLLTQLMTAAGLPWTAWLAVVNLASTVIDSVKVNSSSSSSNHLAPAAVVPLIGGLVHVLQHTMISQVSATMLDMHHTL